MAKIHDRAKSFTVVISHVLKRSVPQLRKKSHKYDVSFNTDNVNVQISIEPDSSPANQPQELNHGNEQIYVLGDDQDFSSEPNLKYLGNGVMLRFSLLDKELEIYSSITGLPAVFLFQNDGVTVVASEIQNIAAIPGLQLQFDPKGLAELATIGHPINHRTMYKGVSVVLFQV